MRYGNPWVYRTILAEGIRMTQARKAVLDILSRENIKHPSADDIYFLIHRINPVIGLATVYRTLYLLTRMGIIQKFDFGDGRARYELVAERKTSHHHHLFCTECRKIIDYTDFTDEEKELIERTEKALSEKYNFKIKNHIIQFYGVCPECSSERR